jgi:glycosyltransferase involved in cell wall biosynthesis
MPRLSVILPSYNEEQLIVKTHQILSEILRSENIDYELLFVNDGSKDGTWNQIRQVCREDPYTAGIRFSRNFGKESAIMAGLSRASGDCCAVMDCDLQHPPEKLIEMYRLWQQGYEVIEGVKSSRGKESPLHRASAGFFYRMMSKATKIDMSRASDFKLMDRKVVNALLEMPERNTFFRALSSWVGFRSTSVEFDVQEREAGESKWSTAALMKYAVSNITSFSSAPMQLVSAAGVIVLLFAIVMTTQTLVRYFSGEALEGFTTVILLCLILGSIIMISLGIIGYYLARIYEEIKGRPRYLISEEIGTDRKAEEKAKSGKVDHMDAEMLKY